MFGWCGLDRRSDTSCCCAQHLQETGYKYHNIDVASSIGVANLQVASNAVASHRAKAKEMAAA
jgi:hypothetical protein